MLLLDWAGSGRFLNCSQPQFPLTGCGVDQIGSYTPRCLLPARHHSACGGCYRDEADYVTSVSGTEDSVSRQMD